MQTILEHIHGLLDDKDVSVVGPMDLGDNVLGLRGGQADVRVEILANQGRRTRASMVHAHVVTTLRQVGGEPCDPCELPACVVGIDTVHQRALLDVARVWVDLAAGVLFSVMTGQPQMEAKRLISQGMLSSQRIEGESSLEPESMGYVGPIGFRFEELPAESAIGETDLFEDALSLAGARKVHLAKVTLDGAAGPKWRRTIEIDGHDATYSDSDWQQLGEKTHGGIAIQFAVLQPNQPEWIADRRAIDDAILKYVKLHATETIAVDDWALIDSHFSEAIGDDTSSNSVIDFVPSAAVRLLFGRELGEPTSLFHHVRPGGELGPPQTLLSQPAFARTLGLHRLLLSDAYLPGLKNCVLRSTELNAINDALHQGGQSKSMVSLPLLVPTLGANQDDVMIAAQTLVAQLPKKKRPWWRLW